MLPLGGCNLTIPLLRLQRRKTITSVLAVAGFDRWPLAFSPGSALQLINVARGTISLSPDLCGICYHDDALLDRRPGDAADCLSSTDVCLIEMTTPVEFGFDGFVLNQNRLRKFVTEKFAIFGAEAQRTAQRWVSSLQNQNEPLRGKCTAQLLDTLARAQDCDEFLRQIVAATRARRLVEEDMYGYLATMRDLVDRPMGIVLYNFRYMPDGRPVDWPAGFKDQVKSLALRQGLPTYDPAALVQAHGVATAMIENSGHYAPAFYDAVAEEFLKFIWRL